MSGRALGVRSQRSRRHTAMLAAIVALAVSSPFDELSAQTDESPDTRPNILVFLSDDMGWGQPGFNGGTEVATPNMDRIADEGVKLTQFYVQPVCSPTRAALLTGRYPWKNGMEYRTKAKSASGMLVDERTIAQELRAAGYATWMVGKWHLGQWRRGGPALAARIRPSLRASTRHWIDSLHPSSRTRSLIGTGTGGPWSSPAMSTFLLADEAVQLIERHNPSRPFFLYLPFNAAYTSRMTAPEEYVPSHTKTGRRNPKQLAMVKAMDVAIGRVMDALERKGVLDAYA